MDSTTLLWTSLAILALGVVGTVVPGLPGMPLVLLAVYVYAFGTGLQHVTTGHLVAFTSLGLLGMGLNYLGNLLGARMLGASRWGLLGALVGLAVGFFVFPPFGVLIGPLVGAVVAELATGKQTSQALRSGCGVVIGYLFGSVAELAIALGIAAWFVQVVWGLTPQRPPWPGLV